MQSRQELEAEWYKIFKIELPKHIHTKNVIKYLNWYKEYKDFDHTTKKYIQKLIDNYEKGLSNTSSISKLEIKIGTKLIRNFKGQKYEVIKTESGFEYGGKIYKSLSAIANEITGVHWNGKRFFGVIK
jgi:hypothetical protein